MATLREWFKEVNIKVDWDSLVVLIHTVDAGLTPEIFAGWPHKSHDVVKFKYTDIFDVSDSQNHKVIDDVDPSKIVCPSHVVNPVSDLNALLDYDFGDLAPEFVAEDKKCIYHPNLEYDDHNRMNWIFKDINMCFDIGNMP